MEAHPAAELFPLIEGPEFDRLVADIRDNGLIDPIVTLNSQILDGRNRQRACAAAGVTPIYVEYTGADPLRFVVSKNLARRHLTAVQCAALANTIANMTRADNQYANRAPAPGPERKVSQEDAAEMTGASTRTMRRLNKINAVDPELHDKVVAGEVTQKEAEKIVAPRPGKPDKVVPLTSDELVERGFSPNSERKLDIETGEVISKHEAIRRQGYEEGYAAARESLQRFWDSTCAPAIQRNMNEYSYIIRARKGALKKAEYNLIRNCLHTDKIRSMVSGRPDADEIIAQYDEAFRLFNGIKTVVMNEKEHPVLAGGLPTSLTELLARRSLKSR